MDSDNDEPTLNLVKKEPEDENICAGNNALPEVSRKKYEIAYKNFMEWKQRNNTSSFSEKVMMTYFEEISKTYKSSTLWTRYSMLRSIIIAKHNVNIANYTKLRAVLKKMSQGYKAKKSQSLSPGEIIQFINTAPDEVYLLTKVALVFGISGAMKRDELCNVKLSDLNDLKTALLVKVPVNRSKTPRSFVITGKFYDIYRKYASLRPTEIIGNDQRFFVNYQKGKCTRQFVGINKFGTMVKDIARFLKLPNPESYTGHSFRRSSATALVDPDGDVNLARWHDI